MFTLKIKITKDILQKSSHCQKKGDSCAFALAVRDIFPTTRVFRTGIAFYDEAADFLDKNKTEFLTPFEIFENKLGFPISREMTDFIHFFDEATSEQIVNYPEQEFTLEIPDWVIEKINIDEVKELLKDHPTLAFVE